MENELYILGNESAIGQEKNLETINLFWLIFSSRFSGRIVHSRGTDISISRN